MVSETLKIGLITASLSRRAGGIIEAVRGLGFALHEDPHVDVQLFGVTDRDTQRDADRLAGLSVHTFSTYGPKSFGFSPGLARALPTTGRDILHAHGLWMYPSVANVLYAKETRIPYLITPHGMLDPWAIRNASWKKRLAGMLYENAHLQGAACIHALCDAEAKAIRDYGLRNPICIIPNGVDLATPPTLATSIPTWKIHQPEDSKTLLYLGRIHPKKGLYPLLRAWSVVKSHPASDRWQLVIAGWDQGSYKKELQIQAEQLGIQNQVHFVGPQFNADKYASYRDANAFILPSHSEGLPMAVLEAWSYSLPVLMTPHCHLPEGFQAKAALCIDTDENSIAQELIVLFTMTDHDRIMMGQRGQALVEQSFHWHKIAKQMCDVYRWILGQGSQPDCVILD